MFDFLRKILKEKIFFLHTENGCKLEKTASIDETEC